MSTTNRIVANASISNVNYVGAGTAGSSATTTNTFITNTDLSNVTDLALVNLQVTGNTNIYGNGLKAYAPIQNYDQTASTSSSTGALIVAGGTGIGGRLNVAGRTAISDTTASTTTSTGALTVAGGTGIGGDLRVQGGVYITGASQGGALSLSSLQVSGATSTGSLASTGQVSVSDTTESSSSTTGALTVAGGLGIGGNVRAGGDLFGRKARLDNNEVSSSTTTGALVVTGGTGIGGRLNVGGATAVTDTTASTSSTTGAVTVAGGAGIGGRLNVGGRATVADTTASTSPSTGALTVAGGAGIGGDLYVQGSLYYSGAGVGGESASFSTKIVTPLVETGASNTLTLAPTVQTTTGKPVSVTDGTASTSSTTGALTVVGGVGVGGALNVGGKTRIQSTAAATVVGSTYDGAMVVQGGAVVGGDLYVKGSLYAETTGGTTESLSLTGKLTTPLIEAGGNLTLTPNVSASGGKVLTAGQVSITNSTTATSTTTGALTVSGGVGVGGTLVSNAVTTGNLTATGTLVAKTRHFRSLDLSSLANEAIATVYTTGTSPHLDLAGHVGYAWLVIYEKLSSAAVASDAANSMAYACALVQVYPYKESDGSGGYQLATATPRICGKWVVEQRNISLGFSNYNESSAASSTLRTFTITNLASRALTLNVSLSFIGGPQSIPAVGGGFMASAAAAIPTSGGLKRQVTFSQGSRAGKRLKNE